MQKTIIKKNDNGEWSKRKIKYSHEPLSSFYAFECEKCEDPINVGDDFYYFDDSKVCPHCYDGLLQEYQLGKYRKW